MPCGSSIGDEQEAHSNTKKELDRVTSLLCELCANSEGTIAFSLELKDWWKYHQEMDRKRLAKEKERRDREEEIAAARAKLTDREKMLLGVRIQ